jgi:phosphohistidine swiveling domain-containing protein
VKHTKIFFFILLLSVASAQALNDTVGTDQISKLQQGLGVVEGTSSGITFSLASYDQLTLNQSLNILVCHGFYCNILLQVSASTTVLKGGGTILSGGNVLCPNATIPVLYEQKIYCMPPTAYEMLRHKNLLLATMATLIIGVTILYRRRKRLDKYLEE